MSKIRNASMVVAAGLVALASASPSVHAANTANTAIEQQSEQGQASVKDAWLHGKLEATLLFNEHLNSFDIDTDVENGTAYLRGVVESDIDRDLAGEIAKSIDGIDEVRNELVVNSSKASSDTESSAATERRGFKQSVLNATLTARIKTALLMNGNTSGTDINVDSKDGKVTLTGIVETDQEKELAVRIASNTNGTQSVNDQLMIEPVEEGE